MEGGVGLPLLRRPKGDDSASGPRKVGGFAEGFASLARRDERAWWAPCERGVTKPEAQGTREGRDRTRVGGTFRGSGGRISPSASHPQHTKCVADTKWTDCWRCCEPIGRVRKACGARSIAEGGGWHRAHSEFTFTLGNLTTFAPSAFPTLIRKELYPATSGLNSAES